MPSTSSKKCDAHREYETMWFGYGSGWMAIWMLLFGSEW